ncbi:MAG: hypothetical protein ING71_12360, partial [Rhodocyclaceae bacterium]|nr:hypothetical protein [Rhodocyclaceae bacterium]
MDRKRHEMMDVATQGDDVQAGLNRLTIRRPDDWHVHLRDGAMLAAV